MLKENEIVLYRPNEEIQLEVRLQDDTVWLNRNQLAVLFGRDVKTLGKHINNALREELAPKVIDSKKNISTIANFETVETKPTPVVAIFATTATDGKTYQVEYYSLDMVLSVGYRVKSSRGIEFRRWANKVLKEYLLRGYSINQRLMHIEQRIDNRLMTHEQKINALEDKVEFFVRTSLPPKEGIFFEGQIFDAYTFAADLVRSANKRILLFDNYIDDTVLTLLDKRQAGVSADIYTKNIDQQLSLDINKHNKQYTPIDVHEFGLSHDRFLIIDDSVYHIGASLKDLGRRWFAFTRMTDITAETLLQKTYSHN